VKSAVEKWRSLVEDECKRASAWHLVNLVLSIIQQESGGKAGVTAYARAGDGSYARGLMQVIGSVTSDYNRAHNTEYDHEADMGGTTPTAARLQIRVGLWLVMRKQAQVSNYLPDGASFADIARIADTAYAMGWGATRTKLNKLKVEGLPLTFASLAERFPKWGWSEKKQKWINRPLHHAQTIYERYLKAEKTHPYGQDIPGGGADVDDPSGDVDAPAPFDGAASLVDGLVLVGVAVLVSILIARS